MRSLCHRRINHDKKTVAPFADKTKKIDSFIDAKMSVSEKLQGSAVVAAEENASNVKTSAAKNQQKSPDDNEADFVASMAAMHH